MLLEIIEQMFEISQYLLTEFSDKRGKVHRGIIDKENEYMSMRADDYPENAEILTIFNFKRDKTNAYDATASAINQGLVQFPAGVNIRNEIEFEETTEDGSVRIRYEKPTLEEVDSLIQLDLAKEELLGMQKVKRPNGTVVYEQTPEAKSNNLHDDRADTIAMCCYHLMKLRAEEALEVEKPSDELIKLFESKHKKSSNNPLMNKTNPFAFRGNNPFNSKR